MLSSTSYLVALLPALALGQSTYTVTVAGVETEVVLPPFPTGDAAAEGDTGVTIPITIGNQITDVVLPPFDEAAATAVVTADDEAEPTMAVESVVEDASEAVESAMEEASEALGSVSSDAAEAATSVAEEVESVTSSVAAEITDAVEDVSSEVSDSLDDTESVVSEDEEDVSSEFDMSSPRPRPLETDRDLAVTAETTTLFGLFSSAEAAASGAATAAENTVITVPAPTGGFATFTVPVDSVADETEVDGGADETDGGADETDGVTEFEGSATQIARSSSLAVVLAGLVAFFFSA